MAVMQAYADGQRIQFKKVYDKEWKDFNHDNIEPSWDWGSIMYQIAPRQNFVSVWRIGADGEAHKVKSIPIEEGDFVYLKDDQV